MVPKVLVPLANGFEEIEAVTIVDVLRRGGVRVMVAGLDKKLQKGSRRIYIEPDVSLEEIQDVDFGSQASCSLQFLFRFRLGYPSVSIQKINRPRLWPSVCMAALTT